MEAVLFYLFAALTLLCGFLVVANPFSRNPVTSAMFVLLHAFFLAAVQILVYAGAVMVLFLFVIMLLDLKVEQRRRINRFGLVAGAVSVGAMAILAIWAIWTSDLRPKQTPRLEGATDLLGKALFSQYLLPFEIVSALLLVAMVGAILLSKRELK
jgi:NADH-quinone oxidoreductase subunit J